MGGLAMLIWAKMKIVGSVPRTAYAEPAPTADRDRKPQPTPVPATKPHTAKPAGTDAADKPSHDPYLGD